MVHIQFDHFSLLSDPSCTELTLVSSRRLLRTLLLPPTSPHGLVRPTSTPLRPFENDNCCSDSVADISGAVVSTFSAGSFCGVLFAGWAADAWGRKRTIQFAALWALVAGAVQAGSVHVGMLIAGRIIGGFAVGIMSESEAFIDSDLPQQE